MTMALAACTSAESAPEVGANYGSDGTAVDYREPVKLSSEMVFSRCACPLIRE